MLLSLLLYSVLGQAQVYQTQTSSHPFAGIRGKIESELQSMRNAENDISGYELTTDFRARKKIADQWDIEGGVEIGGEQESDTSPAIYHLNDVSFGVRRKSKSRYWKFSHRIYLNLLPDSEVRSRQNRTGSIRYRGRINYRPMRHLRTQFRLNFSEYLLTSATKSTDLRQSKFEIRPYYIRGDWSFGATNKITYKQAIREQRTFLDFGPIVKWDVTEDLELAFKNRYRPWDSRSEGWNDSFADTSVYELEIEMKL